MYNLVCTIALAIMLLLLLPASNTSSQPSPDSNLHSASDLATDTLNQIGVDDFRGQSRLCPALLELPVMLGRPTPCLRSYRLDK